MPSPQAAGEAGVQTSDPRKKLSPTDDDDDDDDKSDPPIPGRVFFILDVFLDGV